MSSDYYPTTTTANNTSSPTHDHDRDDPTSQPSNLFTECSKCKVSMSTYDYLLHNCTTNNNNKTNNENNKFSSSTYSPSPSYRHTSFRTDTMYTANNNNNSSTNLKNRKSFSSLNTNTNNLTPKSQTNLSSSKTTYNRRSYDTINTSSSSSGLGASFSSSTNASTFSANPKPSTNSNTSASQSDFVYSKAKNAHMTTPLAKTTGANESPLRSSKILNVEQDRVRPKTPSNISNISSTAQKKAYYSSADFSNDLKSSYTPLKAANSQANLSKTTSYERAKSPLKQQQQQQQTPVVSTTSSMSFTPAFNKPFTSLNTPSYSKSTRLSSATGGITNILNNSYTGLKREKLRTGF